MSYQPKSLFGNGEKTIIKNNTVPVAPKSLFDNKIPAKAKIISDVKSVESGKLLFGAGAKVRKRIEITVKDLNKYSSDELICRAALNIILQTNLDNLTLEYVLDWGSSVQKRHRDTLDFILKFFQCDIITQNRTRLNQVIDKINNLNPEKILDSNILTKFLGGNKKQDFEREFSQLQLLIRELEILGLPKLLECKKECDILIKDIYDIQNSLNPFIVSCSFFAEYKKDDFPTDLFLSRLSSLLSSKTTLLTNKEQVELFKKSIYNFIDSINNVLLTEIPAWYSNYIGVLMSDASRDKTRLEGISAQQRGIIERLKQCL